MNPKAKRKPPHVNGPLTCSLLHASNSATLDQGIAVGFTPGGVVQMGAWWFTRDRILLTDLAVRTGAFHWGMAGILYLTGVPHCWWAQEIDENDVERMAAIHRDSAWQSLWELPAVVVSVDLWRLLLATRAVVLYLT